ncbi:3-demethylubiquinone-9 3-methyltransferase [Nitrosomonas oligotropha]|uniref:3-demethylubiquinone-9 3-methyltransferase n=2 Tax=Nitrosomonas oligotropha TaxID=42354 RepID=A0A2T5HKF9_9PROT|nr:VOC family protein [Nitrosomonas oligotropha]PTQ72063.1 3-demethylubiquinone-9 3-methyltransferase [Nitrosomonas oligotropha]
MTTVRPFLMFQNSSAQTALDLYFATLPDSRMVRVERYAQGEAGPAGSIKVAVFTLCGREFMCSDSPIMHGFTFTPSSSTFVEFDSIEELERVFGILSDGGQVLMPLGNYGFSQ